MIKISIFPHFPNTWCGHSPYHSPYVFPLSILSLTSINFLIFFNFNTLLSIFKCINFLIFLTNIWWNILFRFIFLSLWFPEKMLETCLDWFLAGFWRKRGFFRDCDCVFWYFMRWGIYRFLGLLLFWFLCWCRWWFVGLYIIESWI